MPVSFVVYIDESGDEGFRFDKGSPRWFALSAVITQKPTDLETVKLVDRVRAEVLKKKDNDPLHFRELKHEQRIPFIHAIAEANLKSVSVLIHKPSITSTEIFQQKNRLYFYAARLLLERVSWYCGRHQNLVKEGDGSAQIIFSNRASMKYEEFRDYMNTLKLRTKLNNYNIDWGIIKSDQIEAHNPKLMGLQLADAVASGFFYGVNLNQYGFAEERYARMLKTVVFNREGQFKGYGLKFWPRECEAKVQEETYLNWLKTEYNF